MHAPRRGETVMWTAATMAVAAVGWAAAVAVAAAAVRDRVRRRRRRRRLQAGDNSPVGRAAMLEERRRLLGPNLSVSFADSRPLCVVEGRGAYLYDADGTRVLDCVNNVATVGHSHPRLAKVAYEQLLAINTNTRYLCPTRLRYARKLLATFPPPLRDDSVVFFVNSGSEANDLALRLARAYTGSDETIVLAAAYHGHTASLIEISPYKYEGAGGFKDGPRPFVHKADAPDPYRGRHRGADAGVRYAEQIKHICDGIMQKAPRRVGAFIAESILGCGGQIVLPPGYLQAAYQHVRATGGVCIADEVQVGFGRVGTHFWSFETQGVVPDIVTLGKPMGNGFPLGGVVVRREIARAFANGMEYFNTFGGSNLSCAVGEAVLDIIREEKLQARALEVGSYAKHLLDGVKARRPKHVGDVRGLGLFLGIEIVENAAARTPSEAIASFVAKRAKELGVQISTDGPDHNVLKIKPPMCFSKWDAELLARAIEQGLADYEEGG